MPDVNPRAVRACCGNCKHLPSGSSEVLWCREGTRNVPRSHVQTRLCCNHEFLPKTIVIVPEPDTCANCVYLCQGTGGSYYVCGVDDGVIELACYRNQTCGYHHATIRSKP